MEMDYLMLISGKLINFHKKNKYFVTLTAVRPPARFGGIKLSGKRVKYFKEKS